MPPAIVSSLPPAHKVYDKIYHRCACGIKRNSLASGIRKTLISLRTRLIWQNLSDRQQEALARPCSLFLAGEEWVTLDLLPLIQVIAREGRLEEEIYLTSFLFEEAKHVEGFRRFFDEVVGDHGDLSRYHGPNYRRIFGDELPTR